MLEHKENQLAKKIGEELVSSGLRLVTVETTAGGLKKLENLNENIINCRKTEKQF